MIRDPCGYFVFLTLLMHAIRMLIIHGFTGCDRLLLLNLRLILTRDQERHLALRRLHKLARHLLLTGIGLHRRRVHNLLAWWQNGRSITYRNRVHESDSAFDLFRKNREWQRNELTLAELVPRVMLDANFDIVS